MRRLCRHLSDGLHQLYRQRRGRRVARAPARAGARRHPGLVRERSSQDRARDGQGRGRLPALWTMRRALPDRRMGHAEESDRDDTCRPRLPQRQARTGRGQEGGVSSQIGAQKGAQKGTQKDALAACNDFVVKFANINGSGSASANELFARAILRMGVPVSPRNIFPSNIQGLPTWYEVRVSEQGWLGRRGGVDLMVAMNPQTWDKDLAEIEPGGYLLYDSSKPVPASKIRDDIHVLGVPLTDMCNARYRDSRERQLLKNIIYVGVLAALLGIEPDVVAQLLGEQYKGKDKLVKPNLDAFMMGLHHGREQLNDIVRLRVERRDAVGERIFIDGNTA